MMTEFVDKFRSNIAPRISIYFGLYFCICYFVYVDGITFGKIIAPSNYVALSKDLSVEFQTREILPFSLLNLKVSYVGATATFLNIAHINFYTDDQSNSTRISVPCAFFTRAGTYILHVEGNELNTTLAANRSHHLEHKLDVRWPNAKLSVTHETIETYPSEAVNAVIEFPEYLCQVDTSKFEEVPTFQLELTFCGMYNVNCDSHSVPPNATFPIQLIYGIEKSRVIALNCEYFGLAGNYVLRLRPLPPLDASLEATAYIEVGWSKQYILNIMDIKSTYDCVTGIGVVVKYPACIMDNDRVRLFGKLPADVHSIAKPTSLVYINERRIERGQHIVDFNCELFTDRYKEYCFVYVTEAKTGAVADIREDCVPTSPIDGPVDGKWGKWSNWSECSSKFAYGTQLRYRFCDSPTPKYNGKYCEGSNVETRTCSGSITNVFEYLFGRKSFGSINTSDILEEIGPSCQCGCIIHLLKSKPRRMVASSSQTCSGMENSVWTIQVEEGQQVQFSLDHATLPCPSQSIKIRDGRDVWMSELISEYSGWAEPSDGESIVISSGNLLLIDFHMNDSQIVNTACYAGFIAHVEVIDSPKVPVIAESSIMRVVKDKTFMQFSFTHLMVFLLCGLLIVLSVFLGAQYIFRYHRYQLAKSKEEAESPLNTPMGSSVSISRGGDPTCGNLRATSTSTLMSEVVTLVKLKPKASSSIRHQKLRESVISQDYEKDQLNDCDSIGNYSNNGSINTLTNELKEDMTPILIKKKSHSAPESDTSADSIYEAMPEPKKKLSLDETSSKRASNASTITEFLKEKSQRKLQEKDLDEASNCSSLSRMKSTASPAGTLRSSNYSPALSVASAARIRLNNLKENKEKRNRLMTKPGSQYSISTQEEMEMDYYDYNVGNASAVPGSYLGMDPQYLVWIPPDKIFSDSENETTPVPSDVESAGSSSSTCSRESPGCDEEEVSRVPAKPPRKSLVISDEMRGEIASRLDSRGKPCNDDDDDVNLECGGRKAPVKADTKRISMIEKETSVIKSPSDNKISEYYELSDIKFADDEDESSEGTFTDTVFGVAT